MRRCHLVDASVASNLCCVSVDAKYGSIRAIASALAADSADARDACDAHGKDRSGLRALVDACLEFRRRAVGAVRRSNQVLVYAYSTPDDALDLICLPTGPTSPVSAKKTSERRRGKKNR